MHKPVPEFPLPTSPLDDSLSALALLAMRETGAESFAYFRRNNTGNLIRSICLGTLSSRDAFSEHGSETRACFPLRTPNRVDGVLAFVFPSAKACGDSQPRLIRFVTVIEKVWATQFLPDVYRQILESIIEMESELINSKISTRAGGFLRAEGREESLDVIARHVETVLRPSSILRTMHQQLKQLQGETLEREYGVKAKSILQQELGISEDEAHVYLRKLSRKTRRPFIDVARQVIDENRAHPGPRFFDLPNHPTHNITHARGAKTRER